MTQANWNGGWEDMKSKECNEKLQIIASTPYPTDDIKTAWRYLDNLTINEDNIYSIDLQKLVDNINILLQAVEVLSVYKAPCLSLIKYYEFLMATPKNFEPQNYKKTKAQIEAVENIISRIKLRDCKIKSRKGWREFE